MFTRRRWVAFIVGFIAMVFGGLCLNYIRPGNVEHHRQWGAERGMPPPNDVKGSGRRDP